MSIKEAFVAVVGIDFSEFSNRALDNAIEVATLHGGEVHVVYVHQDLPMEALLADPLSQAVAADTALDQVLRRARERVGAIPELKNGVTLKRMIAHVRRGSPPEEIAQLAADLDADLVVVGSHGRHGLERLVLGSVAEHVSRLVRCPVWIVRPKNHAAATPLPEIEPLCPQCVDARFASAGENLWCARHLEHHHRPRRHTYVTSGGLHPSAADAYGSTPQ